MSSSPTSALPPSTVLTTAPGTKLEIREGSAFLNVGDTVVDAGPGALRILDHFLQPRSVEDVMRQLTAENRNPSAWMEASGTIYRLFQAGILRVPGDSSAKVAAEPLAQSGVHAQARMLNDEARTQAFLHAIKATVKPGDIVLDLGTGTGILSIAAAKAGARVYAMEMTGMADVAETLFANSSVGERIMLRRGVSTELELPERADVLITEIIGDSPFGERVLECVLDARQRLLKPGARMIPSRLQVFVTAVEMPDELLKSYTFNPLNVARWSAAYGIDFSPMQQCATHELLSALISGNDFLQCRPLSAPILVADVDFPTFTEQTLQVLASIPVTHDGVLQGFALSFVLEVGAGETLSTVYPGLGLHSISPSNHWKIPVWICLQPHEVAKGERLSVNVHYAGATRLGWMRPAS